MQVILVDDERIAIDHLQHLIPWEESGYHIAATATNGKSALRLCEELRPQIMIVDIRMPVMNGMELIRTVTEKGLGVKFIVLSAYEDFDYARQAVSVGSVSSYLIKHEVDRDKLLDELNKARRAWESDEAQRHTVRSDRIKELVFGTDPSAATSGMNAPFAMLLFHADVPFISEIPAVGLFDRTEPVRWTWEETQLFSGSLHWRLVGEFPTSETGVAVLLSAKNKNAGVMKEPLRELAASVQSHLIHRYNRTFSVYYGVHPAGADTLSVVFQRLKTAALHAVFCGRKALVCADNVPVPGESAPIRSGSIRLDALNTALEQRNDAMTENAVKSYFEQISNPVWDLRGLLDLTNALRKLMNDFRMEKGMLAVDPFDRTQYGDAYHVNDLADRFGRFFRDMCASDRKAVSRKLMKALQYIHEHYHEDINIDDVSYATGVSPSYLHQLFKRDLEHTFLDYLTEFRINQAKQILRRENAKMTEVASRIGYRSPQHFSQVFKRLTGVLPHQYREEGDPS